MNKIVKVLLVILVCLAALLLAVTLTIDGIIKTEIEENGRELLQASVTVEDVDVSLFGGTGSITGFRIQNPEGFSDEPALRFEQADLEIILSSIFSDEIVVKELIVQNPEIFFEQQGTEINVKQLNDNLAAASTGESETMLIIDHLLIKEGVIRVSTTIDRERNAEVTMDSFELHEVGRAGNNNVKETLKQVLEPLMEQAIQEAAKEGILEQLENRLQDIIDN